MSKTLYLVTGAAGFLGSHVCHPLLERGDEVRTFVLKGDKSAKYIPEKAEIAYGDLCDPDFNQKLMDVNVGGTKNIIKKCLEHPERKWIQSVTCQARKVS